MHVHALESQRRRLARRAGTAAVPEASGTALDLPAREHNRLTPAQAQTVLAAAILRHLHAVITTGHTWNPVIATHGSRAGGPAIAA